MHTRRIGRLEKSDESPHLFQHALDLSNKVTSHLTTRKSQNQTLQDVAHKKIDVGLRYVLPLNGKDLAIQPSNHHTSHAPSPHFTFQLFHLRVFPSIPHPLLPDFMRLWHLKGKVKGEHLPYRCGIAQSTGLLYSFHPRSHLDNWILLRNNQDGLRKLLR